VLSFPTPPPFHINSLPLLCNGDIIYRPAISRILEGVESVFCCWAHQNGTMRSSTLAHPLEGHPDLLPSMLCPGLVPFPSPSRCCAEWDLVLEATPENIESEGHMKGCQNTHKALALRSSSDVVRTNGFQISKVFLPHTRQEPSILARKFSSRAEVSAVRFGSLLAIYILLMAHLLQVYHPSCSIEGYGHRSDIITSPPASTAHR
jgi:hypothetical protein